jgi:hypothetical protein
MLELSSFGGEGSGQGAYRRGRKADTTAAGSDSSASRGSFPLASFAPTSSRSNSSASEQTSQRADGRQASAGAGADAEDTGEQLQRELELFAQDDAEERGLMDNEPYPAGGFDEEGTMQPQ